MKNNIFLATLVAIMTLLASCNDSKLQKIVEASNMECPMSMGTLGEVTSIELEDGNVVFNYSVNESVVNIDFLNENPKMMKRNAVMMFKNPTGDIKTMFEALEEENAGLVLVYKGKTSGKKASITLSRKEIIDLRNSDEEKDPEAALEGQVEVTNAQCPMQIAEGMTITHLSVEGDYVVYNVTCDEDSYSISAFNRNKAQIKENIIKTLDPSDPTMAMFIRICREAGKGIAYKYIGDQSESTCMIKIATSEL